MQSYKVAKLQSVNVAMLQCYNVAMLQSCNLAMSQCFNVAMLQSCNVVNLLLGYVRTCGRTGGLLELLSQLKIDHINKVKRLRQLLNILMMNIGILSTNVLGKLFNVR